MALTPVRFSAWAPLALGIASFLAGFGRAIALCDGDAEARLELAPFLQRQRSGARSDKAQSRHVLAPDILLAVEQDIDGGGIAGRDRDVTVGVGVGLACARPGTSADQLLREADADMYRTKHRRKVALASS